MREISREQAHEAVGEAENGLHALDVYREALPDMILMDISMPIMGGFEPARKLRRIAREIPILSISQHSDAAYVTAAFELGARGYLLKSKISAELNRAIETVGSKQLYRSSQLGNGRPK